MVYLKYFAAFAILGSLLYCKKHPLEPIPIIPIKPNTKLKVLWQKPLQSDTLQVFGSVPHTIDGDFVYMRSGEPAPTPLVRRNGSTGQIEWEWTNWFPNGNVDAAFDGFLTKITNQFMISYAHSYYALDCKTGTTLWRQNLREKPICSEGVNGSIQLGKFAHTIHSPCGKPFSFDNYVVRYDLNSGFVDTVARINGGDSLFINITNMAYMISQSGDSLLMLLNLGLQNDQAYTGRYWVYAYNLSQKKIIWSLNIPDVGATGGMTIIGKNIYLRTSKKLICIEFDSWTKLWERDYRVPNSAYLSVLLEYKNQLIVKCDDGQLDILDPATGALIWQMKEIGYTPIGRAQLFEGVYYFTSAGDGNLYAIDIDNRKLLWNEPSPNEFIPRTSEASFFMAGVAIDTINRRLFTCDQFYAMSIALPDR
jgi:outer membrane protein assembly factor BamB